MLYRVSLEQEALYKVRQEFVVFLHTPLLGSRLHRVEGGDSLSNDTTTGGDGSGSNSHCNVTL